MLTAPEIKEIFPGLLLSAAIGLLAAGFEWVEVRLFGYAYLDGLVVAILAGTLLHTAFGLNERFLAGVKFSAKIVLEIAIVLLGGTISATAIASSGLPLVATIVGVVTITLFLSYGIGRLLGLDDKLATLVSCGTRFAATPPSWRPHPRSMPSRRMLPPLSASPPSSVLP